MATDVIELKPIDATYVNSLKPSTPFQSTARSAMNIKSATHFPLINYGLPRDFRGRSCTSAILEATFDTAPSSAPSVQRIVQPTGKSLAKVTYANRPATVSGSSAVAGTLKAGTTLTYQFNVTADMAAVAAGADFWGFQFSTSDTTLRRIKGATTSAYSKITATLTDATPAPDLVMPNGVVSIQKATFVWSSPNDIVSIQAQADVVGGAFTSPAWDSGAVPAATGQSAQQLNSATVTTPWAGLANGASADLRFRQTGPLGVSPWSATITVMRTAMGSLTISLPTPSGTTNDPTPQHSWTFANQASYRLTLANAAGKTVYDSGRIPGADQSFTPPASSVTLMPDVATMTSTLQVWDTVAGRVSSPGDPGSVSTSWSWTVAPDATTTGPTGVTAAQVGSTPAVAVSWTRATGAPDEWLIVRDGMVVANFDGTTSQTTGTTWQWTDWTAAPNVAHVYAVAAVVSSKASNRIAAATVTPAVGGVWVYDPATGATICVDDEDPISGLDYAASSVIYTPAYSSTPIKKSLALRGLEGTISGSLSDYSGSSIEGQVADAWKIRANPSGTFRVVTPRDNIPALVTDLSVVVNANALPGRMARRISFRVDQVGELPAAMPVSAI